MTQRAENPWRTLRSRPHIELRWLRLPPTTRGVWWSEEAGSVIGLSVSLGRRDRNATLMHELVHDERGIGYTPSTPVPLVEKEEVAVERITARRLVPAAALQAFVTQRLTVQDQVTATEVADEFDVPIGVAELAIRLAS